MSALLLLQILQIEMKTTSQTYSQFVQVFNIVDLILLKLKQLTFNALCFCLYFF